MKLLNIVYNIYYFVMVVTAFTAIDGATCCALLARGHVRRTEQRHIAINEYAFGIWQMPTTELQCRRHPMR